MGATTIADAIGMMVTAVAIRAKTSSSTIAQTADAWIRTLKPSIAVLHAQSRITSGMAFVMMATTIVVVTGMKATVAVCLGKMLSTTTARSARAWIRTSRTSTALLHVPRRPGQE